MQARKQTCPECGASMRTTAARGDRVRCPQCQHIFVVADRAAPPETKLKSSPAPLPPLVEEAVDALEVVPVPSRSRPRPRPDDESSEDESPRRRPQPASGGGIGVGLVIALVVGGLGLFVLVGGGVIALLVWDSPSVANDPLMAVGAPVEVPPVLGADTIPRETLEHIKNATTFIKLDAGAQSATGTGFIISGEAGTGLVVTNHHVITPDATPAGPGRLRPPRAAAPPRISVVLRSGTPKEETVSGQVVASDEDADLAVVRITGVRDMPRPVDLSVRPGLAETMPLFLFGFPFGKSLALDKGNPAITVGKASVSSLRKDSRGELALVQINGDLNPGNSGGPVVDARGHLVGVAVATIRGTQIGMAVPSIELTHLLNGRVGSIAVFPLQTVAGSTARGESWVFDRHDAVKTHKAIAFRVDDPNNQGGEGEGNVVIDGRLVDPLGRVRNVAVLLLRGDAGAPQPVATGGWAPMGGAERVVLKTEGDRVVGRVKAEPGEVCSYQISFVDGLGRTHHTQPRTVRLDGRGGPVAGGPNAPPNPPPVGGQPVPPAGIPAAPPALGAQETVILRITGADDEATRQAILNRLPVLIGGDRQSVRSMGTGKTFTVTVGPVTDVAAFAAKIDFGKVDRVTGRAIMVTAKAAPPAPLDEGGVAALLAGLRETRSLRRVEAAEKLAACETNDKHKAEVMKALEGLLTDRDHRLRTAAMKGLAHWGKEDAIPILITQGLTSSDVFSRRAAIEVLGKFKNAQAAEAIAGRLSELSDRHEASRTLRSMGAVAQKGVLKYLDNGDWGTRLEVCRILQEIGTKSCVSVLTRRAAQDDNPLVRNAARDAAVAAARRS